MYETDVYILIQIPSILTAFTFLHKNKKDLSENVIKVGVLDRFSRLRYLGKSCLRRTITYNSERNTFIEK